MELTPAQRQIAKDTHRFRVLCCGRRFGKTTEAIEEIKGKALASKEFDKIAYIAPTYQQARDIAWEMLKKELRPITKRINESRLELEVMNLDGKAVLIVLRGWESIETLRGQKFVFVVLDEVAMMRNFWLGWQEVIRPTLTDMRGEALFISTPKGFNHFYDLYNFQDKDSDYKSFHYTTFDNPFIPRDEIEKAQKELPEDRFAQEYMADFRKQEGLVYKEFDRTIHLFDDFTQQRNEVAKIAGVDFGYTNPCAVIHIKKDSDNHYWVTQEYYKTQQTEAQVGDYIAACKFSYVFPDPESPSAIKELTDRRVNVREVIKNGDSIKSGIDKVRELLKQKRLHIHKDCIHLITEMEMYRYPDKKPGKNEYENPVKENDHAMDALRYALSMDEPYVEETNEEFSLYGGSYR